MIMGDTKLNQNNYDREDIINKISELTEKLSLTADNKKEISDYISYNEYGLAFETLCSVIEQEGIHIDCNELKVIEKLGSVMKYDDTLWNKIKVR